MLQIRPENQYLLREIKLIGINLIENLWIN